MIDIDLSRDEDSVTSLAIGQSSEASAVAFAGINSSEKDQKTGRNEHLRCFRLHYVPRRRSSTDGVESEAGRTDPRQSTEALGKFSLFTPSTAAKKETYQRVLRLLRPSEEHKAGVGAVATGLAPEGEIVLFDYMKPNPTPSDGYRRIQLAKGEEAADLDLVWSSDGFWIAHCTDYEVFLTKFPDAKQEEPPEPQFLYGTPFPDAFATTKSRPKFRSLRFLAPNLLLLLQNLPDRKGAELLVLEIPKFSSLGTIVLRKRLHRSIKAATALSVALLPPSSSSPQAQNAIAVAGQDNSITVLTLERPSSPPYPSLSFHIHAFLASVHSLQITSLVFSTFNPPPQPSSSLPQYLKLASTSIASTVVIHTFPLSPFPPSPKASAPQRYVLRPPGRSEAAQITFSVLISALAIALGAFFLQAFTEIRGGTPEYLGAKGWLSERMHGYVARPYMFDDLPSMVPSSSTVSPHTAIETAFADLKTAVAATQEKLGLRDLLSRRQRTTERVADEPSTEVIVVSPHEDGTSLSADVRDPAHIIAAGVQAKRWEDMHEVEKDSWKRRLVAAGEWALEEGDAVLQGVLFSSLAEAVGDAVGGMMV